MGFWSDMPHTERYSEDEGSDRNRAHNSINYIEHIKGRTLVDAPKESAGLGKRTYLKI